MSPLFFKYLLLFIFIWFYPYILEEGIKVFNMLVKYRCL